MNITKLMKIGTGPKPHTRSFRLRNSAVQAIGRICKVTGLSAKVSNIFDRNENKFLYNVIHSLSHMSNPDNIQENEFVLENIKDLLDFGFSSNYEIYSQQPKLEESE